MTADAGPVFIAGLSYSGKTELRLLLGAHPNIAFTRRTYMWPRYYGRFGDLRSAAQLERCLAAMLRNKHISALEPDIERIRREFRQGEPSYARLFALFHAQFAERQGKARWGDQLGFAELYAEPILRAYPAATMIHMVRDPRERYAEAVPRARRRRGKLGWDTARWLHSVRLAQRSGRRYPERYMVVRYERLLADPAATLRAICAAIGEPLVQELLSAPGALDAGGDERAEAPAALSAGELAFTQRHAGREMRAYGYAPAPAPLTRAERLRLYAVDWPANLAAMAAWRTLERTPLARH